MPEVNMLASRDPTTSPIENTQNTGKVTEVINGGNCFSRTEKFTMKYIMIIQNTQTKRVKNIVNTPPILKNLWLFKLNISAEFRQLSK